MEDRVARVYRFKKVLKYSIFSLLIAIVGLLVYEYFRIAPNNVYFTNISSNSITVSWDTKSKTDATAIYTDKDNKLPFVILPIFKDRFFDTRDITKAELEAATQSIANQEDVAISMSEMVTNVSVTDRGRYYTHHVEIRGLEPEKEYSFMVGDSIVFRKVKDVNNETVAKTYAVPETIISPKPAYGSVVDAQGRFDLPMEEMEIINDGILYFNFYNKSTGEKSNLFSSPLNEKGRWYIDVSGAIDNNGNLFPSTPDAEEEINIYAELRFNGGKIGTFSRLDNAGIISPTNDFVLNLPETEISFQNKMLSPFIKNFISSVNAAGPAASCGDGQGTCIWVTYCGLECRAGDGSKYYYKDKDDNGSCGNCSDMGTECRCQITNNCVASDEVMKGRSCFPNEETMECTMNNGTTRAIETPPIMDAGHCRACIARKSSGDGGTFYAAWENLPDSECDEDDDDDDDDDDNPTPVSREAEFCEDNLGTWNIELQRCDCKANATWVNTDMKACKCIDGFHNSSNRCVEDATTPPVNEEEENEEEAICETLRFTKWEDGTCKCVDNATPIRNRLVSEAGCMCTHFPSGNNCNLHSPNAGETCYVQGSLAFGMYDSNGDCQPRDSDNQLNESEILDLNCWYTPSDTDTISFYDSDGRRFDCDRETNDIIRSTDRSRDSCNEGDFCRTSNTRCVNLSSGKFLRCDHGKYSYDTDSDDNTVIIIGNLLPKEIELGTICDYDDSLNLKCYCPLGSGLTLEKGQTCPQVTTCTRQNSGSICDISGNKCTNFPRVDRQLDPHCESGENSSNKLLQPKVFAQEQPSTVIEEKYIIDQTTGMISGIEEGVYTFEIDGVKYTFIVTEPASKKGDVLIFIDMNNNGVFDEETDKKLSEFGSEITVQVIKKAYVYQLKEGYNFVSFPFLNENKKARKASGMLTMLNDLTNGAIYSISKYDGSWKIVGQNGKKYDGKDFQLVPGQGYIIKSMKNVEVRISGYPIKYESAENSAPITLMPGWNLIGIYGSNVKSYTAKSMLQDINAFETPDFTADNVTKWESSKQRYEGFQLTVENDIEIEYGFDYPIDILKSYFVKVKEGTGNWQPLLAE